MGEENELAVTARHRGSAVFREAVTTVDAAKEGHGPEPQQNRENEQPEHRVPAFVVIVN